MIVSEELRLSDCDGTSLFRRSRICAFETKPLDENFGQEQKTFLFSATMLPCHTNISIREGGEAMEQESKWIRDIQRGGSRQAVENLVERYYDEIYVFV